MLKNAQAAAAAKLAGKNTGLSKVQQMLAGRENPTDTVELSPVAKLLQQSQSSATEKPKPYTEQEWYVTAKIAQLKGQIYTYSNLPGLDPSGMIMESLTKEVNDLVTQQQKALKETQVKADEAKKKLDEQKAAEAKAKEIPDVETMLKRAKSGATGAYVPSYESTIQTDSAKDKAVEAMLKKVGAKIDTKA